MKCECVVHAEVLDQIEKTQVEIFELEFARLLLNDVQRCVDGVPVLERLFVEHRLASWRRGAQIQRVVLESMINK